MDVAGWRDQARGAGYDRLVIHDRDEGDAAEVGNFLSVHRSGESWSRWGFARHGLCIHAWCCLSGADMGAFASLDEALAAVLRGDDTFKTARSRPKRAVRGEAAVTSLSPHIAACPTPLGSAA